MLTTHLHLTDDELLSLTHLRRPSAQARALKAMGVPFRTRPDGTLLVGRIAAERALTGPAPAERFSARRQPMGAVEPDGVRIFNAEAKGPRSGPA